MHIIGLALMSLIVWILIKSSETIKLFVILVVLAFVLQETLGKEITPILRRTEDYETGETAGTWW